MRHFVGPRFEALDAACLQTAFGLPNVQVPNLRGPPSVFSSEGSTRLNSGESSIGNQDTQQLYASMFEQLMPDQGHLVRPLHLVVLQSAVAV